ncbi:MAG: 2-dehydro-3-deoxy-6-phosphogalactonate aldolase [Alteromonadaceae bacterium]|nr:2-dehydro-3-deoxy-6-phosphogalactonate aldolase [Alteromonadaceae bacterium]MBH85372.1 2-dehydro-3-deoxy-6-phosphogalactonate aldolase [Alteromonadaceae bacterium]
MANADFDTCFSELPLIAILRGVKPTEVISIVSALVESGFRLIEVPLNSPDPFASIAALTERFGDQAFIGAGTVTRVEQVQSLKDAGGQLMVMPHSDVEVIRAGVAAGMTVIPGFMTPTEAFSALAAGAHALKLFPADLVGVAGLKAMRSILPPDVAIAPTGGISPENLGDYHQAGAQGFGLGSALYRPGMQADDVKVNAQAFVQAWKSRIG